MIIKIAGIIMMLIPFAIITTLMIVWDGWKSAFYIWLLTAAILVPIIIGVLLLDL